VTTPVAETLGVQDLPQMMAAEQYVIDNHLAQVISQSFGTGEDCRIGDGPWRYLARNGDVTLINDKINNSCGAASPTASTKLTYTGTTTAAPGASEIRSGSGVDSRRGSVPCVPRRLSISSSCPW